MMAKFVTRQLSLAKGQIAHYLRFAGYICLANAAMMTCVHDGFISIVMYAARLHSSAARLKLSAALGSSRDYITCASDVLPHSSRFIESACQVVYL